MPWQDSANPLGAGNEQARVGEAIWVLAATPTTLPLVGTLVAIKTPFTPPTTPGDTNQTTLEKIYGIKAPDSGTFTTIGVCVGGSTLGANPVAGGTVMVAVEGIASVRFAATTTAGHVVIQTTAHAGYGKDSATATLGKTFGTILTAKTISTGTALVPCHIHKF